jgi:hypothetical protein
VVEVKDGDVFERTIVRGKGIKVKATSFALPAVEVGSIVEYRWTEFRDGQFTHYAWIPVQRDVPIQVLRLGVRMSDALPPGYRMRLQGNDLKPEPMVDGLGTGGRTFSFTRATNIPAYREEPDMPPEHDMRSAIFVRYSDKDSESPEQFWRERGKELNLTFGGTLKASAPLKTALPAIVGTAASPLESAQRICEYCRTQIKRLEDDASGLTPEEVRNTKANRSPADTLERRIGTDRNIVELFGALAATAGLETRIVALPDRSRTIFNPQMLNPYALNNVVVAVRIDGQWRFYDPSETYVECGRLRWQNEGVLALVIDSKGGAFSQTPFTPANDSQSRRSAKLRLVEDGTLEGDVTATYSGHIGSERKEYYDSETASRREELLREGIKARQSTAELSQVQFENVTTPSEALRLIYHVRVPGYGRRTGKRLFFQPSFFRHGMPARFTAGERKHPVYFDYPWSELDEIEIELPGGFDLENADAPAPLQVGDVVGCSLKMSVTNGTPRVLKVERRFSFGGSGAVWFEAEKHYSSVKGVFDLVHSIDDHALTLRQVGGAP